MAPNRSILSRILSAFSSRPAGSDAVAREQGRAPGWLSPSTHTATHGDSRTRLVDVRSVPALRVSYAPSLDGAPDAGEIVWTWVPYSENDGRGKDRPVLVIAAGPEERVFAVRLTSKGREGDPDLVPIGSGSWDSRDRPSWVGVDQLYSVHALGMRREAAVLDRERFGRVARALRERYGWKAAE